MTQTAIAASSNEPLTPFVINLCSSTTPVALAHPDSAELKRYTFFVTRRREEGRDRFRLHMGYFDTSEAAELLLTVVRDVYPAAWVGHAPGARVAASRAPVAAIVPAAVEPAPLIDAAQIAPLPAAVPAAAPLAVPPVATIELLPTPAVAATAQAVPEEPPSADPLITMSNVREVLAALGDESATVHVLPELQPTSARKAEPGLRSVPEPKAAKSRKPGGHPASGAVSAAAVAASAAPLSDTQVLRILEQRCEPVTAATVVPADIEAQTSIRMLTPEDTQTLRSIKEDVQRNAPVSFAVQLVWSVQPIDIDSVSQLAIFDAYTLYAVEGNRQGRRWYGLRLGFFSDAVSAKQVAYYLRSDFASVAVVPVTLKERERANGDVESQAAVSAPSAHAGRPLRRAVRVGTDTLQAADTAGFELLREDQPVAAKRDVEDPASARPARVASGKRALARDGVAGKAQASTRVAVKKMKGSSHRGGPPQTLEETLEILGATTLSIDNSHTLINDSGVRHLNVKVATKKNSRFSRLLDRLSHR